MDKNFPKFQENKIEEKDLISKIEALDCSDIAKMYILLVYKDLKPTASIIIGNNIKRDFGEEGRLKVVKDFTEICENAKINFIQYANNTKGYENLLSYYISKNKEFLDKISKADFVNNKNSQPTGELLGYPQTAVNAYVLGEEYILSHKDKLTIIPKEILEEDYMAFLSFMLSKEHWQDEVKILERYSEVIKKTAPDLHKRLVDQYKLSILPRLKDDYKTF